MELQAEPVTIEGDLAARADTLGEHGATEDEVAFLLGNEKQPSQRVELNAMTSRQFVDFLERKLTEHGVEKVMPDQTSLTQQARRLIEAQLTERALDNIRDDLAVQAAAQELPLDLADQVRALLAEHRELPWDAALARIIGF